MPPTTAGQDRRYRGITLIEMLITVTLIGILSGIAASRLDWGRYRADAVSRGLMAELSTAQRLAVSLQTEVRVTQPTPDRLLVHEDANNDGAVGGTERVRTVYFDDGYLLQNTGVPAVPSPSDATQLTAVVFRRDGSSSRSGTFYLRHPGDPACKRCRAVSVTRATGRLVWYSYSQGAWRRGN